MQGICWASAVTYPGLVGIRMRAMGSDGNWGAPYTMKLPVAHIAGVGYADKDEKVYFSAIPAVPGAQGLYYVSIKESRCRRSRACSRCPPGLPRTRLSR